MQSSFHYLPSSPSILTAIQDAVSSQKYQSLLVERPVTLNFFDLQKIAYQLCQQKSIPVYVNYQLRLASEVQQLRQQIAQNLSSGNSIISISVNTIHNGSEASSIDTQDIDLILSLVNQDIASVQALGEASVGKQQAPVVPFTLISGAFISGTTFTVQVRSLKTSQNITNVQVYLSNGEVLSASVKLDFLQGNPQDQSLLATLDDAIRVNRVYLVATESLRTQRVVPLKYARGDVTNARTIGTATFTSEGLFQPASLNKGMAITSLYSAREERIREIFNNVLLQGEPLEYVPNYEELLNYGENRKIKPYFYTPSLPGARKNQEIIDALKADCVVLAEKPAFANADLAREFSTKVDVEAKKRLFFGWHYQHHYVIKRVYQEIVKKTFGAVKHVRTHFSVPKVLDEGRIFDPRQGGAGVDILSYSLHCTMRLIGFEHSYEILEAKIQNCQEQDPSRPELSKIDYVIDTKLAFGNGVTADSYATFDPTSVLHTEVELLFEDGTRMIVKEFVHPQIVTVNNWFSPVVIKRVGSPRWEDFLTEEEKNHVDYVRSSYDQQIDFMRRQSTGEEAYDAVKNDIFGLGVDANIKLGSIIDDIFAKGGYEKKPGA